jgi:MFS transporter, YQGE family, putative transporter
MPYTTRMQFLKNTVLAAIAKELKIFQGLSTHARSLTLSILCFHMADIIIFIFAYAFLFRSTNQFQAVAIFNLGFFITLPFAYILNSWLLRHLSLKRTSLLGLVGEGLVLFSLFFIPDLSLSRIFIVGLCLGVPMGLYWSSRLFLFTSEIPNSQRDYVSGINSSVGSLSKMVIPALVGWFIASAPTFGFSKLAAYQFTAIIATLLFFVAGLILHSHPLGKPNISQIWVKNVSKRWKWFRVFIFLTSIQFTITLALPESLILAYLGDEKVLGLLLSATNIFAALALYVIGRKVSGNHRARVLTFALIPLLFASTALLFSFSKIIIIAYLLMVSLFDAFFWFVYYPLLSHQVEQDNSEDLAASYPYLIDHEIVINAGRVLTSLFYLLIVSNFANAVSIPIIVLVAAFSQIGILVVVRKL